MLGSTPWHQRSSTLVPRPKEGPSRHNGSPWASSSGTPASKPAREQSRTPAEASYTLASPWISCHHISMRRGREASRGRQATTRGWAVCRRRVRAFVPAWRVSSSSSKKCLGGAGVGLWSVPAWPQGWGVLCGPTLLFVQASTAHSACPPTKSWTPFLQLRIQNKLLDMTFHMHVVVLKSTSIPDINDPNRASGIIRPHPCSGARQQAI